MWRREKAQVTKSRLDPEPLKPLERISIDEQLSTSEDRKHSSSECTTIMRGTYKKYRFQGSVTGKFDSASPGLSQSIHSSDKHLR